MTGPKGSETSVTYLDSRKHDNGFWACAYRGKLCLPADEFRETLTQIAILR